LDTSALTIRICLSIPIDICGLPFDMFRELNHNLWLIKDTIFNAVSRVNLINEMRFPFKVLRVSGTKTRRIRRKFTFWGELGSDERLEGKGNEGYAI
jgi:hypothetical protein